MVKVELELNTLAVLIAGLYCTYHEVGAIAIPESVWLVIAEKLEYFLPTWNYNVISFENFIQYNIFIYPTEALDKETLTDMCNTGLYWEMPNGNITLSISMDIKPINGEMME